jgi:hypothetical protein
MSAEHIQRLEINLLSKLATLVADLHNKTL